MTIEEKKLLGGISIVTLSNGKGMTVELSNLGAGIVSCVVPDAHGNLADVALGYRNPADYDHDDPCMGKIPGRYAGRIGRGLFSLDGKQYKLATNCGPDALHGGPDGFHNRLWEVELMPAGVRFTYRSKDGEEGYPGNLTAVAEYSLEEEFNRLNLDLRATCDAPSPVNLTNHTYWNLSGEDSGSALDHLLQLNCSRYLPTSPSLVPTGEMAPVAGTPMDFLTPAPLRPRISLPFQAIEYAKGYDTSWVVDGWEQGKFIEDIVTLEDPCSGRRLKIGSTQPAAHIYTGNWLKGSPVAKSGRSYDDYAGVAVEMQGMPDAPNRPEFPSQILRPDEEYHQQITYTFSAI